MRGGQESGPPCLWVSIPMIREHTGEGEWKDL